MLLTENQIEAFFTIIYKYLKYSILLFDQFQELLLL